MSFFDDIKTKAIQTAEQAGNTIYDHLASQVTEKLVKIVPAPSGNLTQAQVEAGQRGATAQIIPLPAASTQTKIMASLPLIAGAAAIAYFVLNGKKGRRA